MSIHKPSFQFPVSSFQLKNRDEFARSSNSKLETRNWKLGERGLSLVELIMFIVIVSAAVAGIIGVISITTRSSADPMIRKQALAIAEAVLEEAQLQPYTFCDPDDPTAATADATGASIAFDASSSGGGASASSLTWSHTTGSGANRILVVGVSIRQLAADYNVSSITYNGIALTAIGAGASYGTIVRTRLYYLVNPPTGTYNIVVTLTGSTFLAAGAASFSGVDQANPIEAFNGNTGGGTGSPPPTSTPNVSVTTLTNNAWVVDNLVYRRFSYPGGPTATPTGAGQTDRWAAYGESGGDGANVRARGSTIGPKTPAGATTMSWTLSDISQDWAVFAAALKPAGGCPTLTEAIGPEAGETRYSVSTPFDNVNDYHGFDSNTAVPSGIRNIDGSAIAGLEGYRVQVSVAGQTLGGIGNDASGFPQSLLITVTVTGPGNTTVTLHGYRTRYAPNALP